MFFKAFWIHTFILKNVVSAHQCNIKHTWPLVNAVKVARNRNNFFSGCLRYTHPWTLKELEQDQRGQQFKWTVCHEEY